MAPEEAGAQDPFTEALQRRLGDLRSHGVPVRSISAGPRTGVARLRFADGTTLLVVGAQGHTLTRLLRALRRGQAMTIAEHEEGEHPVLTLSLPTSELLTLTVMGPDQPD